MSLAHITGSLHATMWRVDPNHANAFSASQRMGSPPRPSPQQVASLTRASRLVAEPVLFQDGALDMVLPRQGVALIELRR